MFWLLGFATLLLPLLMLLACWRMAEGSPGSPAAAARYWGATAALMALIGVVTDSLLAHGPVPGAARGIAETAADYQLLHGLALLAVALAAGLQKGEDERGLSGAGWGFAFGIALFSGSLYLRSAGLGAVSGLAPLGGMLLIIGWIALAIALWRRLA